MGGKTTTQKIDQTQNAVANTASASSGSESAFGFGGQSNQTANQTGASSAALAQINPALGALSGAFGQSQGMLGQYAPGLDKGLSSIIGTFGQTDPGIAASNNYASGVLGGQYLNGNGWLQGAMDSAANDAMDMTNASVGARGAAGGSQHANLLSRNVLSARNNLLNQNYQNERQQQTAAAQIAAMNSQAESNRNSSSLQQLISAMGLPQALAGQYASGVNGLVGNWMTNNGQNNASNFTYGGSDSSNAGTSNTTGTQTTKGTNTTTESGGLLGSILGGLAGGVGGALGRIIKK